MRTRSMILGLMAAALLPTQAPAQDGGLGEVIVTASRRSAESIRRGGDDDGTGVPAIGLRRVADSAIWFVTITGDTRDAPKRRQEIYDMLRGAIERAGRSGGIELATGTYIVEPLTLANYRDVPLRPSGRPDTEQLSFIVKTKLAGGVDAKTALDRVEAFIKGVPAVGRAELTRSNAQTLSIIDPDKYRSQIADLVAADAKAYAAKFGPDFGVEVTGLDRPVEWSRVNLTEILLYLPYSYTITPPHH